MVLEEQQSLTKFEDLFSYEIWDSTYRQAGEETIDDTMRRVAKAVASAEKTPELQAYWEEQFFSMLTNFKCMPGGRIYANAGTEWTGTSMLNCFDQSVKVLTHRGYQPISDVEVGDLVYTHKNRWKKVVNTLKRRYVGDVNIFKSNFFTGPIITTPEHPFYQGDESWINAEDISHCILLGENSKEETLTIDLVDYFKDQVNAGKVIFDDEFVYTYTTVKERTYKKSKTKRFIEINKEFGYFIGRFIGDGSTFLNNKRFNKLGFNICFNKKEEEDLQLVKTYIQNLFDVEMNTVQPQQYSFMYLSKYNPIISDFLNSIIGSGFAVKRIPSLIWNASKEVQFSCLSGLFDSDGMILKNGALRIVLSNENLINDIQALLLLNNILSRKSVFKTKDEYNDAFTLQINKYIGSKLFNSLLKSYKDGRENLNLDLQSDNSKYQISKFSENIGSNFSIQLKKNGVERETSLFDGYVYNLSIEDDESFVVNNVVVHNCFVSPRTGKDHDSMEGIMRDVLNQCLTLKGEGGWGQNFCFGINELLYIVREEHEVLEKIGNVKKGDLVYSDDNRLHEVEAVLESYKNNMVRLTLENGKEIVCTDDHPFLVTRDNEQQWVLAKDILDTDDLVSLTDKVKVINKEFFTEKTKVIDLQIADRHNFAIGEEKIIVHNSFIRPRGAFINKIGVESPGAVKFMEIYDKTSDVITSGSGRKAVNKKAKKKIRKGALMGVMDVHHPDIEEFIRAKQHGDRLQKFNLSVNCTDKFMQKLLSALEAKGTPEFEELDKWNLIFPEISFFRYEEEWDGDIEKWQDKGYPVVVYKTVSITGLWDLIMENTYKRNDPGVLFIDRANYFNPLNYLETILATNPCVTGDTLVSTSVGDYRVEDIVNLFNNGEKFFVNTYNTSTKELELEPVVNAVLTSPSKQVLEIVLDDGKVLRLTPDHKVYTSNRGYVSAGELTADDDIVTSD